MNIRIIAVALFLGIMPACSADNSGAGASPLLIGIAVTPASPSMTLGATQQFTAQGSYSDGSTKDLTSSATWTCSDATIASLGSNGTALAVSTGTTVITATTGSVFGTATLTVTSSYVLATQLSGGGLFKIDPANDQIVTRLSFSDNPGRPATDVSRRMAYLPLGDQLIALKADTMETSLLTVTGLGKDGSFASISPDGKTLAVVNHGADGFRSTDDRLDIVTLDPDVWPPTASLNFSVEVGQQPIRALMNHTGRYAVVSVRDTSAILVIDLVSKLTTTKITLAAGAEPEGMDIHPDQNIVYVTLHGQNAIELLDLDAIPLKVSSVAILSGKGSPQPSGGYFTPDGSRFYVSGQVTNEILLFDTSSVTAPLQDTSISLPSAQQPHDIVFLTDGRAYAANTYNGQSHGSLSVMQGYISTPAISGQILSNVILNPLYLVSFP